MNKGLVIEVDGPPKKGGSDVEDQERRNALRAFMSAVQNGDVEQGLKAWARMDACGPAPSAEEPSDDAGLSDNPPKGGKTSMYRDEED
jgi:hypothetical protein